MVLFWLWRCFSIASYGLLAKSPNFLQKFVHLFITTSGEGYDCVFFTQRRDENRDLFLTLCSDKIENIKF